MRQFIQKEVPENTYVLTDKELSLIHAMSFYFSSINDESMTPEAMKICMKLTDKLSDELMYKKEKITIWK